MFNILRFKFCPKIYNYQKYASSIHSVSHLWKIGNLSNSGSPFVTSRKAYLGIFFFLFLLFLPVILVGHGYEYRQGYLKYKSSIGLVTFSQSIHTVNVSGQLTEVCAQLWLDSDLFPPPANASLYPARASSDSTIRDWYWNTLFSEFFEQDVSQLLINDFPALSLLVWPAELNLDISSAFFINPEQDRPFPAL